MTKPTIPSAPPAGDMRHTTPEEPLDETPLAELIGYQLAQAAIVTSRIFQARVAQPYQLNPVEFTLLALIRANPGVSPTQLRKALGISKPYVTAGLDKLGARKMIDRHVNPCDQRAHHLYVTAHASEQVEAMTADLLASERSELTTLSAAERAMLAELLHKLARVRS